MRAWTRPPRPRTRLDHIHPLDGPGIHGCIQQQPILTINVHSFLNIATSVGGHRLDTVGVHYQFREAPAPCLHYHISDETGHRHHDLIVGIGAEIEKGEHVVDGLSCELD